MSLFEQKAPHVMEQLMHDFGLADFQAAGVLGSIGRECGGFEEMRENGALAGRGGYGWAQWTGQRGHEFLAYAHQNHLDWTSDEANYGFLEHELSGAYKGTAIALKEARTTAAAVIAFERQYERAGIIAMSDRLRWAKIALNAYRKEHPKHVG